MGIILGSGSFRGRFGDHFRVGDHFGVRIISGAVQALATTWACERLADYLIGKRFHVETDHKLLVPILGSKT